MVLESLCTPGSTVAEQALSDLPEMPDIDSMELVEIHADNKTAKAISSMLTSKKGQANQMVFTFLKQDDGRWLIDDIDLENAKGLQEEIKRFTTKNPDAKIILEKKE